jgi:glycosyltransferase involved in cell wall biosynthesis
VIIAKDIEDKPYNWDKFEKSWETNIAHGLKSGINLLMFAKLLLEFSSLAILSPRREYIFIMPHPWDLSVGWVLKLFNNTVTRIIHDAKPHLGEFWPTRRATRKRCLQSDKIICLSNYIKNLLIIELGSHLPPIEIRPLFDLTNVEKQGTSKKDYILFLGRGKRYQGSQNIVSIIRIVSAVKPEAKFLIAGEGYDLNEAELGKYNYKIINRWLATDELNSLITEASVLVLPYLEASQSGLIPKATRLKTAVVVAPIGGLVEQISPGVSGEIASTGHPFDLAATILQVIENIPRYHCQVQADLSSWGI